MSWIKELAEIYDKNSEFVGREINGATLLPVYHSTQNAQIDVVINLNGEFKRSETVEKNDCITLIPVTEDSASRSSGITPHPLEDKLIYVAGDYEKYVGGKSNIGDYFDEYISRLEKWHSSENTTPKVDAIYKYLSKGSLIADLVACKTLSLNECGKIDESVSVNNIKQPDFFVRFTVADDETPQCRRDLNLISSYIEYAKKNDSKIDLCYVSGEMTPVTYKHISKIRNTGDKAKLLSANDETNFTFKGRFATKEQAFAVGSIISQKAHLALRWLIERQGIRIGDCCFVAFENSAEKTTKVPDITESTPVIIEECTGDSEFNLVESAPRTMEGCKQQLTGAIFGKQAQFDETAKIIVIGLNSATPGRLSMCLYHEFFKSQFYRNIINWHSSFCWDVSIFDENEKWINYVGAPPLKAIAKYAYGVTRDKFLEVDKKLMPEIIQRLVPCVINNERLPSQIYEKLLINAASRMKYSSYNMWYNVLKAACAAIRRKRYENNEEDISMALDENCKDRSYLYGRALAILDGVEKSTFTDEDKNAGRLSNAERYTERMVTKPSDTLNILYRKAAPYMAKLREKRNAYDCYFIKINGLIEAVEDFNSNEKLSTLFFIGYYHQKQKLFEGSKKNEKENNEHVEQEN